jgi:hypothetical protein
MVSNPEDAADWRRMPSSRPTGRSVAFVMARRSSPGSAGLQSTCAATSGVAARARRTSPWRMATTRDGESTPLDVADSSYEPARLVEIQATAEVVRKAIDTLSPDHREVVVMHHLQGLPVDHIAQVVGRAGGHGEVTPLPGARQPSRGASSSALLPGKAPSGLPLPTRRQHRLPTRSGGPSPAGLRSQAARGFVAARLQTLCGAARAVLGEFDSHTPSPFPPIGVQGRVTRLKHRRHPARSPPSSLLPSPRTRRDGIAWEGAL